MQHDESSNNHVSRGMPPSGYGQQHQHQQPQYPYQHHQHQYQYQQFQQFQQHQAPPQPAPAPAPAPPPQKDFLFVDASESAKSSRQGRRNARSFVMQKARRERPWSTSKHAAKQSAAARKNAETASVGTPELSTGSHSPITATPSPPYQPFHDHLHNGFIGDKRNLQLCQDCQIFQCRPGQSLCPKCILYRPAPADDVDGSLIDPFGTLAVEMNPDVSRLLDHYLNEMAPGSIAIDIRNKSHLALSDWFGTAVSNRGFMHSLLCTVSLHMFVMGKGSFAEIMYYQTKAVTAVNAAISDPQSRLSDANIGAVFNLLCVEESLMGLPAFQRQRSDEEQANQWLIHLSGLRQMIEMRGGLRNISSNRLLQAFIFWYSTVHAVASFEAPYLPTIDYINTANFRHHPPGYRPNFSHHLLHYCTNTGIKDTLTDLVRSTLILIADLNAWFGDPRSPLDPFEIQNSSCVLEMLLLQWLRNNEGLVMPLEDALCVALLIFTVRTTEAFQPRAGMHHLHLKAGKRLQKALCATSRREWLPCPDLLLWILSIGAISAEGSDDRSWFIYQTSLACAEFGIDSGDTLLAHLHHCGWVSFKLDEAARSLWNSISTSRASQPIHHYQPSSHYHEGGIPSSQHYPSTAAAAVDDPMDIESAFDVAVAHLSGMYDEMNIGFDPTQGFPNMPIPVGPLQFQVSEPDFSDWQTLEAMGMGGGQPTSGSGSGGDSSGEYHPQHLGSVTEGLYDLAVTYVTKRNHPIYAADTGASR